MAQNSMLRRKEERNQEQTGLHKNDATGGGTIRPIACINPKNTGKDAASYRQPTHSIKAIGE